MNCNELEFSNFSIDVQKLIEMDKLNKANDLEMSLDIGG
jgi:hypothetical protein